MRHLDKEAFLKEQLLEPERDVSRYFQQLGPFSCPIAVIRHLHNKFPELFQAAVSDHNFDSSLMFKEQVMAVLERLESALNLCFLPFLTGWHRSQSKGCPLSRNDCRDCQAADGHRLIAQNSM